MNGKSDLPVLRTYLAILRTLAGEVFYFLCIKYFSSFNGVGKRCSKRAWQQIGSSRWGAWTDKNHVYVAERGQAYGISKWHFAHVLNKLKSVFNHLLTTFNFIQYFKGKFTVLLYLQIARLILAGRAKKIAYSLILLWHKRPLLDFPVGVSVTWGLSAFRLTPGLKDKGAV